MSDTSPIAWALDLLAAHSVPALGEDEDPHRLLGELVSLGWDVSWSEAAPSVVRARANWLPVGVVKLEVDGQDLGEAATFALALALELQGTRNGHD